jgi:ferredoxin
MLTIALFVVGTLLVLTISLFIIGERGLTLRPSTLKTAKEYGLSSLLNLTALRAYIYMCFINQYIKMFIKIGPYLGERGKKWASDHYHGKVLTHEHAHAIVTNKKDIPLQDLEQIIPYPAARKLVLSSSPDIVVSECPCRHARENPCKPTQVCMVIGKPFTDFTLEHHPERSRRLTQAEALEILEGEHKRGHIHTAWFKDTSLDRFFVLCNCCKCCCGGIEAMVKYDAPALVSSGYVAKVNKAYCIGCGTCANTCPFGAISIENKKAVINWGKCMGCGVCEAKCPKGAIKLKRDKKKGIPLDVRKLASKE